MKNERAVEQIITTFIFNTYRLRPQLTKVAVQEARLCALAASRHPVEDAKADIIPLTTGSVAEFYIEPMLPHIGDIDVMFHWSTLLAIPRGHPPPTQLPDEYFNYVRVGEIIDSHLLGYVYLELRYLLTECVDDGNYNAVEYDRGMYLSNRIQSGLSEMHGPALLTKPAASDISGLSVDAVPCVRCLVWLPQAVDWPTRHRNYDWPDPATVDRVVSKGCDVVPVAHRQCRQHEWIGKYQWRLSFSRAEIVLLNSWMPTQQIVYHILRVFMKPELLAESADNSEAGTLSNYHIKTLMLWACEQKPRVWWTDSARFVKICVELLHDLADRLAEAKLPHYFVNNCNLVDSSFKLQRIHSRLVRINNSYLSSWFVHHYIRKCSQLCPQSVSRLFDDISSLAKLQSAVSAVVRWRQNAIPILSDMWNVVRLAAINTAFLVSASTFSEHSLTYVMTKYGHICRSFHVYFLSVVFLHVAHKVSLSGLNDELMDVLAAALGQSIGPRRYSSRRSSVLLLSKAVNLMKALDDRTESRSTVQLIEIELSKAYLYRSLTYDDSDSDCIYCLANVYLAVLYYTTEHYQTAIDHFTLVTRLQGHSQCSSHVIQREFLPKIDDDIDIVLGLSVLYQHVRTAVLNQQQQTHVTAFTAELFAHYMRIRCLSVTKCQQVSDATNYQSSSSDVQSYVKCTTDTQQLFVTDVLLRKFVNSCCVHRFMNNCCRQYLSTHPCELDTSHLVELLQKFAVEHLTSYRQIEARDFGFIATIVTTDFEALYAYKRGDYQEGLLLSTENVRTLLRDNKVPDIPTFPDFIQLMDDDIVSLTAMTLIVHSKCRTDDNRCVGITQLTLSLYLMAQCQLNLHHSVTSLAQTLHYIKVAHTGHPVMATLDRLVLKMISHKTLTYITTMMNKISLR